MSALGKIRPPIFSRPWFAALAMTFGASAMALGAYTAENPPNFTIKSARVAAALDPAELAPKVVLSPRPQQPESSLIVLDTVRIAATVPRRHKQTISRVDACKPGWRSLAMGPEERQVREFCPTPGGDVTKR